jgi:hypothetical protein
MSAALLRLEEEKLFGQLSRVIRRICEKVAQNVAQSIFVKII